MEVFGVYNLAKTLKFKKLFSILPSFDTIRLSRTFLGAPNCMNVSHSPTLTEPSYIP